MPIAPDGRWSGPIISVALHVLLILLLLAPAVIAERTLFDAPENGGGPGEAGGGGGGSGGTGGRPIEERIQYIDIAPGAIPALIPEIPTPLPEPVIVPPPEPVVTPPPPPPPVVEPKVDVPPAAAPVAPPAATSVVAGTGGGSGNDGTAGMGPGSGGGVGSGIGTGRGSGIGPGTGGGDGNIYTPRVIQVPLPPSNPPSRITPYTVVAFFDVDEKGKVLKFEFNESKDRDYNKKVKAMLAELRFRPATTLEGVAIRATAKVEFTVY
jgi:protein TonB